MPRELHPRRGTHAPTRGTPPRRPGSIRRTSTIDMLRPGGLHAELRLVGRARELRTDPDGSARVLREAALRARVEPGWTRALAALELEPALGSTAELIGTPVSTGFRAALDAALPGLRAQDSLLYQLLDDLPTAALVSGYALGHATEGHPAPAPSKRLQHPDLCAGWRVGGTILLGIEQQGMVPVVTGPEAPSLLDPADPLAWHAFGPLPPTGMRRHRRVDVSRGDGCIEIDAFFRDSHMAPDGLETAVHEYSVRARLDPATGRFEAAEATPRALPWLECPSAAASAGRLVGSTAEGMRKRVREEFVGPTTCTHLNDTLRALEDVPELAARLAQGGV
jgi:hypothetical protein